MDEGCEWRCRPGRRQPEQLWLEYLMILHITNVNTHTHAMRLLSGLTVSFHVSLNIAVRIFSSFLISAVGQCYNIWHDVGNEPGKLPKAGEHVAACASY